MADFVQKQCLMSGAAFCRSTVCTLCALTKTAQSCIQGTCRQLNSAENKMPPLTVIFYRDRIEALLKAEGAVRLVCLPNGNSAPSLFWEARLGHSNDSAASPFSKRKFCIMANKEKSETKINGIKIGAVIILIISAIVFVFFGFGMDVFATLFGARNRLPPFGVYKGHAITYEAGSLFQRTAARIADNYRRIGYNIDERTEYYIFNNAFIQTVMELEFSEAVKKSGWTAPVNAINRGLIPHFSEDGKYSPRLFNQTDETVINNMRKEITENLIFNRYTEDVLGGMQSVGTQPLYGLKTSEAELDFIASMGKEKRSFNLAAFDTDNFPKTEAVQYGQNNAETFIQYDLLAVTLDDAAAAKTMLKQLSSNEITFEDAVTESQKYYTDSDGNVVGAYRYQIASMLANADDITAVTGLAKDTYSDVIETRLGYTIFRGNGEARAPDFAEEAMQDVVLGYIKANETGFVESYYIDIANNFITQASLSGFDVACERSGIAKVEVPAIPLNYGNTDYYAKTSDGISELSNLYTNADALAKLFSLNVGDYTSPFVLGPNVLVMQCTGIQTDEAADTESYAELIRNADASSMQETLMASDKLENDFTKVFFNNFMNTSSN